MGTKGKIRNPNPPPEHTWWKKGQSGNPSGRPKAFIYKDNVQNIMGKLAHMSRTDLEAFADDPKTPALESFVANVLVSGIRTGDAHKLDFLLNRTIGKVTEVSEVHQTVETMRQEADTLNKYPKDNVLELLRDIHSPKPSEDVAK